MKNTTRKSSHFAQSHSHGQFILFYHRVQFFTYFRPDFPAILAKLTSPTTLNSLIYEDIGVNAHCFTHQICIDYEWSGPRKAIRHGRTSEVEWRKQSEGLFVWRRLAHLDGKLFFYGLERHWKCQSGVSTVVLFRRILGTSWELL